MSQIGLGTAAFVPGAIVTVFGMVSLVAVYAMTRPVEGQHHAWKIFRELCKVASALIGLRALTRALTELLTRRRG